MDSRSVAIAPLSISERTARWTIQRRCQRAAAPRGEGRLFTITDLRVHHADRGVHDGPIPLFTMRRSGCSRWTDLSVQHGPKPAGIFGWLEKKGIEKGRANLQQTVEKLIRAADASWAQTEKAMQNGLPIPRADPSVMEYQKELLSDLSTWKGSLPDIEAVELIGSVMRTSKAGAGGQMAIRFVVIDQWPKHGKPTISTAEMEQCLGSRAADEELVAAVQAHVVKMMKGQK